MVSSPLGKVLFTLNRRVKAEYQEKIASIRREFALTGTVVASKLQTYSWAAVKHYNKDNPYIKDLGQWTEEDQPTCMWWVALHFSRSFPTTRQVSAGKPQFTCFFVSTSLPESAILFAKSLQDLIILEEIGQNWSGALWVSPAVPYRRFLLMLNVWNRWKIRWTMEQE